MAKPKADMNVIGSIDRDGEDKSDYRKGGYHPVRVGEKYKAGRYVIEHKLGWGHFSVVWLASDRDTTGKLVALKFQKSQKVHTEAALDEIELLTQIRNAAKKDAASKSKDASHPHYVVELLDHFIVKGPHGRHVCLVFEVLGKSLLDLVKIYNYNCIPIDLVKIIIKQILIGLDFMHTKCQIIHTDLKPENCLLLPFTPLTMDDLEAKRSGKTLHTPVAKKKQAHTKSPRSSSFSSYAGKLSLLMSPRPKRTRHMEIRYQQQNRPDASRGHDLQANALVKIYLPENLRKTQAHLTVKYNQDELVATLRVKICAKLKRKFIIPKTRQPEHFQLALDEEGKVMCDLKYSLGIVKKKSSDPERNHLKLYLLQISGVDEDETKDDCSNSTIVCKIADLGTACWTNKHFTTDVQTRQYRAPEVIVGYEYDTAIDIWSVACIAFELLTGGDYLFNPAGKDGRYSRDEDHLAYMIELMGDAPEIIYARGRGSREMFNERGQLRNIKSLKHWGLAEVLQDKYAFESEEAEGIADFLCPMLQMDPKERSTAAESIAHPWIKDIDVTNATFLLDLEDDKDTNEPNEDVFETGGRGSGQVDKPEQPNGQLQIPDLDLLKRDRIVTLKTTTTTTTSPAATTTTTTITSRIKTLKVGEPADKVVVD